MLFDTKINKIDDGEAQHMNGKLIADRYLNLTAMCMVVDIVQIHMKFNKISLFTFEKQTGSEQGSRGLGFPKNQYL